MNKKLCWLGWVISIGACAPFIFSAAAKVAPHLFFPEMPEQMEKIGLPLSILPIVAALEILCIVVYLIPPTAVLGAVLFTGYLGGAMLTHLRVEQSVLLHIVLGGLIWLGIYIREPRLRQVLPIRKKN